MKKIFDIRSHFSPVQPSVSSQGLVSYTEFLPHEKLAPFICCYWFLSAPGPLAGPFHYRVVADGCMDLFFDLHNPEESFVMGFSNTYTEFPLEPNFNYVGVRFFPGIFPQLCRNDASELRNRSESLHALLPDAAGYISKYFHEHQSAVKVVEALNRYFFRFFSNVNFRFDPRLFGALHLILSHSGSIQVESDIDTGASPRQLRRLFDQFIGATPKSFCRVARFQQILKRNPTRGDLKRQKLFFDYGYYDQSHFIREFRQLYGLPPSQAFQDQ